MSAAAPADLTPAYVCDECRARVPSVVICADRDLCIPCYRAWCDARDDDSCVTIHATEAARCDHGVPLVDPLTTCDACDAAELDDCLNDAPRSRLLRPLDELRRDVVELDRAVDELLDEQSP